jgi:hypothetical protein
MQLRGLEDLLWFVDAETMLRNRKGDLKRAAVRIRRWNGAAGIFIPSLAISPAQPGEGLAEIASVVQAVILIVIYRASRHNLLIRAKFGRQREESLR